MPPVNELSWLELARRYAFTVSSINGDLNSADVTIPVLHYLYGDGGLLCGSSIEVAGIEADANVLAMATKKKNVGRYWSVDCNVMESLMVFPSISSGLRW